MIDYAVSFRYMLAGYAAIFIILAIYLVSLFRRWQKLKHDYHSLVNMDIEK